MKLKAPFQFFGGKSKIAPVVWERFGAVVNYVEPFFGSGAVLLARPTPFDGPETVNDKDCFLANFWRAVKSDPEAVAEWADWPVNEADLEARHKWLVERERKAEFRRNMKDNPDYFDAKTAGWWVWGLSAWIGQGWCAGEWVGNESVENRGRGINTKNGTRPHLGGGGRGVHRQIPNLGRGAGGVHSKQGELLIPWFAALADRLRRVRVCCGEWDRVTGPSVTWKWGPTAVFLDPPYSEKANRDSKIYAEESLTVAVDAAKWAIEQGENPLMRIAFCGYAGEHEFPPDWDAVQYSVNGGFANQGKPGQGRLNRHRETVWFSPHCTKGFFGR
jgi:hypothetical protein